MGETSVIPPSPPRAVDIVQWVLVVYLLVADLQGMVGVMAGTTAAVLGWADAGWVAMAAPHVLAAVAGVLVNAALGVMMVRARTAAWTRHPLVVTGLVAARVLLIPLSVWAGAISSMFAARANWSSGDQIAAYTYVTQLSSAGANALGTVIAAVVVIIVTLDALRS